MSQELVFRPHPQPAKFSKRLNMFLKINKGKGKHSLVHAMKTYGGNGNLASLILNYATRRRTVSVLGCTACVLQTVKLIIKFFPRSLIYFQNFWLSGKVSYEFSVFVHV